MGTTTAVWVGPGRACVCLSVLLVHASEALVHHGALRFLRDGRFAQQPRGHCLTGSLRQDRPEDQDP